MIEPRPSHVLPHGCCLWMQGLQEALGSSSIMLRLISVQIHCGVVLMSVRIRFHLVANQFNDQHEVDTAAFSCTKKYGYN